MNAEWEELKRWGEAQRENRRDVLVSKCFGQMLDKMQEIERRDLPERVAEILEKASTQNAIESMNIPLGASITRYFKIEVAKALRTGELSEIEKWVKE